MNKNIEILKRPSTSLKTQNNYLMDSDEITNLEIDLTTLSLNFESFNPIECVDDLNEYVGVEVRNLYSKAMDIVLISSLDLDLLKSNLLELFDEYEIDVRIEASKTIGKSIKQYQLIINIFKDRDVWEETYYA